MYISDVFTDNLFLLEFLVENLEIDTSGLQELSYASELCISLTFFDKGPLELCEEECKPINDTKGLKVIQNGKSCLFALDPDSLRMAHNSFKIHLSFYKKFDKNILPNRLKVGDGIISISSEFQRVLERLEANGTSEPISESNIFSAAIRGALGGDSLIGFISIYIRISGFGKIIVSEIKAPVPEEQEQQGPQEPCEARVIQKAKPSTPNQGCPCRNCRLVRIGHDRTGYVGTRIKGGADVLTEECDNECPGPADCADTMAKKKRKCVSFPYNNYGDDDDYCPKAPSNSRQSRKSPVRCAPPPTCISSRPCTQTPSYCSYPSCYPLPYPCPPVTDCTCSSPRCFSYPSCGCTHGATNLTDPCDCLMYCPAKRGHPCVEKQVLSLTPGDDPVNPFAFKISGCGAKANQNISVVPPVTTRPDGMKVTEISDPAKDVFTLRIGQKDETDYRKPRLELELVTRKPSPPNVSVKTQFDPCDYDPLASKQCHVETGSVRSKKSKKSKKKGKGKGKKKKKK